MDHDDLLNAAFVEDGVDDDEFHAAFVGEAFKCHMH